MIHLYPTNDGWHAPAPSLTPADVGALSTDQRAAYYADMSAMAFAMRPVAPRPVAAGRSGPAWRGREG